MSLKAVHRQACLTNTKALEAGKLLGMVVHPSTPEAEAGGSQSQARLVYRVSSRPARGCVVRPDLNQ